MAALLLALACTPARPPLVLPTTPEPTRLPAQDGQVQVAERVLRASLPTLLAEARRDGESGAWGMWLKTAVAVALEDAGGLPLWPVVEDLRSQPGMAFALWRQGLSAGVPKTGEARLELALCALAAEDAAMLSRALEWLGQDEEGDDLPPVHEASGLIRVEVGRPGEAAVDLSRVALAQPRRQDLDLRIGRLLLAAGQAREALPWARKALGVEGEADAARLLLADIHLAALRECRAAEADFDDKLIGQQVDDLCALIQDEALATQVQRRRSQVVDLLPTAEDRFFNHYDQARKVCYQWLLQ
jgi:tetratricopeptide (TPR) repeat protein